MDSPSDHVTFSWPLTRFTWGQEALNARPLHLKPGHPPCCSPFLLLPQPSWWQHRPCASLHHPPLPCSKSQADPHSKLQLMRPPAPWTPKPACALASGRGLPDLPGLPHPAPHTHMYSVTGALLTVWAAAGMLVSLP